MRELHLHRRGNQSLTQMVLSVLLGLLFLIGAVYIISTSGPKLYQTFLDALGLGMSLDDFQSSVMQLNDRASQPIPLDKKLEQYQQIIDLWDKFSTSNSAGDIDSDTRKILLNTYDQLLKGYATQFMNANCPDVAANPQTIDTYQKACEKLFKVYESSTKTRILPSLTEPTYHAMNSGIKGVQRGFHAAQGIANIDDKTKNAMCSSMILVNDICIGLDAQAAADSITVENPSGCSTRSSWVKAAVDFTCPNAELDAPGTAGS